MGNVSSQSLYLIFGSLLWFCMQSQAETRKPGFQWQAFDVAVKEHVRQEDLFGIQTRVVAYEQLRENEEFLAIAIDLKGYNPDDLAGDAKLAFYINAYNYFAIKIVLDNWPVKSIKDIGGFFSPVWRKTAGYINNKAVTLDFIEHQILRKLHEPRMHFAIVCSSNSCPDLRSEIYTATDLDRQLDDQVRQFVRNGGKGAIIIDDELYVSKIFKWFEEDFDSEGGVIGFLSRFEPAYEKYDSFDTLDYDWRLNNASKK